MGALTNQSYFLGNSFMSGARLLDADFMDSALRGLMGTPVQKVDNCFADDITSQLFRLVAIFKCQYKSILEYWSEKSFRTPGPGNLGSDLISLNLQRGRDHGLRPYADYWSLFNGGQPLTSFDQLSATTNSDVQKQQPIF